MKVRSLTELQDALDNEMSWRFKEIVDLKSAVSISLPISKRTIIRAGIPLVYAHWEGFVKTSSDLYLSYINGLKLNLEELCDSLVAISIRAQIDTMRETQKFFHNIELVNMLRNKPRSRISFSLSNAIDTKSNLNSDVFRNIADYLAIDTKFYETKFNFIDESLLSRRNKVAHGEYLDVNDKQWKDIADEVLNLLRAYKTDIENSATLATYKRHS